MYPFPFRKRHWTCCGQIRSLGVNYMTEDLIHGSIVSYQAEDFIGSGTYGTLIDGVGFPVMVWPGLVESFDIGVKENYDETWHLGANEDTSLLENVRNTKVSEELPFSAVIYPQKTQDWNLLPFIVGGAAAFSDSVDSTSWIKELNGKFTTFTGIMFESLKIDIPERGKVKQTISGFAGHQTAPSETDPLTAGSGTHASKNTSDLLTWADISSIKMDDHDAGAPTTAIDHCIGDISLGFTSEITKRYHPESSLSTKICGVKVVKRTMELSLTLTYVDQTFITKVTGATKQDFLLTIGTGANVTTFTCNGLLWPEYIAKAEPNSLIGDTITAVVDQPSFTYVTA